MLCGACSAARLAGCGLVAGTAAAQQRGLSAAKGDAAAAAGPWSQGMACTPTHRQGQLQAGGPARCPAEFTTADRMHVPGRARQRPSGHGAGREAWVKEWRVDVGTCRCSRCLAATVQAKCVDWTLRPHEPGPKTNDAIMRCFTHNTLLLPGALRQGTAHTEKGQPAGVTKTAPANTNERPSDYTFD